MVRKVVIVSSIAAVLLVMLSYLFPRHAAACRDRDTAIGFIGDSITKNGIFDDKETPADHASTMLSTTTHPVCAITFGISGTTTLHWLPDAPDGFLQDAMRTFASYKVKIVHVMLGTNDAHAGRIVPPAMFTAHVRAISLALAHHGFMVLWSYAPYVVPGGAHGGWSASSDVALRAYQQCLQALAREHIMALGDTSAYRYFAAHPALLYDGVHLSVAGNEALGSRWAARIRPWLAPVPTGR